MYIGALAARYFRFSVGVDEQVQSVELDFSGLSGLEHLRVDALIDNVAGWIPEPVPVPLDGDPRPRFCFDLGPSTKTVRGAFAELRLVLSNRAFTGTEVVSGPLRVRPSKGACAGDWSGVISWSQLTAVGGSSPVRTDLSTQATVTFEVNDNPPGGSVPGMVWYKVRSGRVSYHGDFTSPGCHDVMISEVEMSPDATTGTGATYAGVVTFSTNGVLQYGYNAGATIGDIVVSGNCTAGGMQTIPNQLSSWWDLVGTYDLKDNGTLMEEDITNSAGARYHWSLRKGAR